MTSEQQSAEEFSHEEVVASLLELVEEGFLEMSVDPDGCSVFWISDEAPSSSSDDEVLAIR